MLIVFCLHCHVPVGYMIKMQHNLLATVQLKHNTRHSNEQDLPAPSLLN